jgi:serine/threonine-protein kinase
MPAAGAPTWVGQVLDKKYKIVRHIADGGMGAVYEAEHLVIGKHVAIKALLPQFSKSGDIIQRFQREARAASGIGHQNIIDIADMGHAPDGSLFIVMELLRGQNLAVRLASLGGRMPVGRACHIVRQVLDALGSTHRHAIIHRDLKPENIFLVQRGTDPDFVKVLDFGISKVLTDDQKLSTTGVVLGTPYYMSPEQARGGAQDHRLDIYACGAILYQLLTGRLPFTAANFNALMFEIAGGRYLPPRQLNPQIPPQLETVVQYAMALDPNQRYQSAEQMAHSVAPFAQPAVVPAAAAELDTRTPSALHAFVPPPPALGTATPVPMRDNVMGPRRRNRALPITIGAGIAVGLCVGLFIVRGEKNADPRPAETAQLEVAPPAPPPPAPAQPQVLPAPPEPAVAAPDAAPVETEMDPDVMVRTAPKPIEKIGDPPGSAINLGVTDPPPKETPPPKEEEKEPVSATLTFTIEPAEAAAIATITVNGAAVQGTTATVTGPKAKVQVKAKGWYTWEKKLPISGDAAIDVKMTKKPAGPPPAAPGGSIKL